MRALFAYGFRPNFLAAGLAAAVLVPLWLGTLLFGVPLEPRWTPVLWHGHEMLFGFVAAAIGGFLLTAVPSWTGRRGFAGPPLVALTAVWIAGRLLPFAPATVPAEWIAAVDLSYLPGVAALVAPALFRTRNRNRPLLLVLAALTFCNAAFHWHAAYGDAAAASQWLRLAIDLVVVLTVVIGGRIVPAFTASGLRERGVTVPPAVPSLEIAAIGAVVLVLACDYFAPGSALAGVAALGAGAANLARAVRWTPLRGGTAPLVRILHLGYAWIPAGLLLKGTFVLSGAAFAATWLHALTIGVLATMILGVMTRASLGHTGRELRASAPTVAAYASLGAAAVVRAFGTSAGLGYVPTLLLAGTLWTAAFAAFLYVYAPMLVRPRVDGREG